MRTRDLRIVLVALLTATLALPAFAAEDSTQQDVDVRLMDQGVIGIWVDGQIDLGLAVVDPLVDTNTYPQEFGLGITNTTTSGWEVYVTAPDFESFDWDWENCDDQGNCPRLPTDPVYTIPASGLYLNGGDEDLGDPSYLTSNSGYLVNDPLTPLLAGTADAFGEFGINNPPASMYLTVPAGATAASYWTTVTYTIMTTS